MNFILVIFAVFLLSCTHINQQNSSTKTPTEITTTSNNIDSNATTIATRFLPPKGFQTLHSPEGSFAFYLQNLPLKPTESQVKYYNGETKSGKYVYCSVIDMDIDPVDLQQCADAVMRLRGEYLYKHKRYSEIKFNFLSDGKPRYYTDYVKGDYSYSKFRKYLKYVFSYANTGSLHDELHSRPWNDMQIGDVLVQKRQPYGHAVTIVNMAADSSGKKLFMLAQSYMPAQETQILSIPIMQV